jgi:hypothetical protein
MFRVRLTIAITLLGAATVFSQEPVPKETPSACSFSEIYKSDGWTVPGLSNAKIKKKAIFTNLPGVSVTFLEPPQAETTITSIGRARNNEARLEIEEAPIRILELSAYEYKGRTFAYGVHYEIQYYYEGSRRALGAASGVLFYDAEGSDKFTVRKYARWPFLPEVPSNWPKTEIKSSQSTAKPAGAADRNQQ